MSYQQNNNPCILSCLYEDIPKRDYKNHPAGYIWRGLIVSMLLTILNIYFTLR